MTGSLLRRAPRDLMPARNDIIQLMSERVPPEGGPQVKSTDEAMWRLSVPNLGIDGAFAPKVPFGEMIFDLPNKTPWKEPKNPLPIDESISDLLRASGINPYISGLNSNRSLASDYVNSYKKHKIVFNHELSVINLKRGADLVIDCPYEFVRQRIAAAVGLAYDAEYIDQARRGNVMDQVSRAALLLKKSADIMLEAEALISEFGVGIFEDKYTRRSGEVFDKTNLSKSIRQKYIDTLGDHARLVSGIGKDIGERVSGMKKSGRPENAFWISFIIDCAVTWRTITGRVPTQGNADFARFVRRANISLGGTRDDFSSPIKVALEHLTKAVGEDEIDFESNNSGCIVDFYKEYFRSLPNGQPYCPVGLIEIECANLIIHAKSGNKYARKYLNNLYIVAGTGLKHRIRGFMVAGGVFDLR